jgi:hypothetical protein
MANQVVFFVHGMGTFHDDWALKPGEALRGYFNAYKLPRLFAAEKTFDFVSINYNDVFVEWQNSWKTNADAAAKQAGLDGMESKLVSQLLKLAKAPTGDGFFQTHLLDVVLFYSFEFVSQAVQVRVAKQIVDRLMAKGENNVPVWHVIAHSLGTAVITETLHALFSHKLKDIHLGDAFKPQCVAMVANTSRLLWNKGGAFDLSLMRPDGPSREGVCRCYLNFCHKLDPIPQVKPFWQPPAHPPVNWLDPLSNASRVFVNPDPLPADDLQSENVHSLEHYLSHPSVHVPLIRQLLQNDDAITRAEYKKAVDKWRADSLKNELLDDAKKKLNELASSANDPLAKALAKWIKYRTDIGRKVLADGESE